MKTRHLIKLIQIHFVQAVLNTAYNQLKKYENQTTTHVCCLRVSSTLWS